LYPYNIFIEKKIKIQNKRKLRAREEGELRQKKEMRKSKATIQRNQAKLIVQNYFCF